MSLSAAICGASVHVQNTAAGRMLTPSPALLATMEKAQPMRLDGFALSDGDQVTLDLEPVALRAPVVRLVSTSGVSLGDLPSPQVYAFSGHVDGEPDSRAFIGFDGERLHGWVQTYRGLDVIAAEAGQATSWLMRQGEHRPTTTHVVEPLKTDDPANVYERLLLDLQHPDRPFHPEISGELIMELVNRAAGGDIDYFEPRGACCIAPGFCYYIDEDLCGQLCNPSSVTCDDMGPSMDAPCWLGEGVGCDTRWACFEENDEGGWVGACCYPDPSDPAITVLADKQACECALIGGTFLIEPANCMSGIAPQDYPADRFVSADLLETLDPDACNKPSGACCIDQDLLCLPDSPDIPLPLDQVTCMLLPKALCESDDEKVLTALNASVPGVFTRECFPCVSDTAVFGPYSDAPPICSTFTVEREVDDDGNTTSEAVALLEPYNFRCAPMQITLELDPWLPDLFGTPGSDESLAAATGYATLLFAAVADLYAQEAKVPLILGELIVLENDANPLGDGACCLSSSGYDYCWENAYQDECEEVQGGDFQGHGSTCFSQPCGDVPTYGGGQPPMSIEAMLHRLMERWGESGACCIDGDCEELSGIACEDAGGVFHASQDCGAFDCDSATGSNTRAMIIALAGAPFLNQWYPEQGASQGLYEPRGLVAEVGGACRPAARFGVAPVRGGFAPPPSSNEAGNAQWDFVMLTQVMTRLLGVSMTDDYGYDDCYTRFCRGMGAKVDCELLWNDPMAWALGDMASTIMSNCLACEGGLSNLQMRFRSEIAARIYATAAAAPCSDPDVTIDEAIANNDVYQVAVSGPTNLDVTYNDVPAGCAAEAQAEPVEIAIGSGTGEIPLCTVDPATGLATEQQGWVCVDTDVDDNQTIRYTPPDGFCGVDRFSYTIEDAAVDNIANVTVIAQGTAGQDGDCALVHSLTCDPECTWSDGEASEQSIPPVSGDPNVITIDASTIASLRVDSIRWQDLQLEVFVNTSQAAHATMRFWFTSEAGGSDLNVFWDITPYGDTIGIRCQDGPIPVGLGGGTPGVNQPVSGVCDTPATSTLMYVPVDGQVLVQCFEQLDEDNGQVDAAWIAGSLCLGAGDSSVPGACCLGGLCIQATAHECASLRWSYDARSNSWYEDPVGSGFFMGAGTTCDDNDWCNRPAPCCLGDACVEVSEDNCALLGGRTLKGTYGALVDTPCAFTVCSLGNQMTGACCVTTEDGLRFCTDLTVQECATLPLVNAVSALWTTEWQMRAPCEFTPCGSMVSGSGSGSGACCFVDTCCTETLAEDACGTAGGVWIADGSCDDCMTVESGVCCLGPRGPLAPGTRSACIEGVSSAICEFTLGGTWVADISECTAGAPCGPWDAGDACCLQGTCIEMSEQDCALVDGRYIRAGECDTAGVCNGGTCCIDGPNVAADAPTQARCEAWGGRWIGSGTCIFTIRRNADVDGDGRVGAMDMLALLQAWGTTDPTLDLDGDGTVGIGDLLTLISVWGQ
ncbi:MAG: hypothetical protein MK074_03350 [Phycisphaerales bacterium]|nr:hypothetical protein [Phycisphaerales bacterium]